MSDIHINVSDNLNSRDVWIDAINALKNIQDKAGSALSLAAKSAAIRARKAALEELTKKYAINEKNVKNNVTVSERVSTSKGQTTVVLHFQGMRLPLMTFNTAIDSNGAVKANVIRANTQKTLNHAFVAVMSTGHAGIFERKGKESLPIIEKYGPAVPQMIGKSYDLLFDLGHSVWGAKTKEEAEANVQKLVDEWGTQSQ